MKEITILASVALLGVFGVTGAFAQKGQEQSCCEPQAKMGKMSAAGGRRFNAQHVETIRGEVMQVQQNAGPRGKGVHLMVKTEQGQTVPVALGPAWFIEHQPFQIKEHDRVEVKGSRVNAQGHRVIVAEQVTLGNDVLHLRDANGRPAWAAWRRTGEGQGMAMGGPGMNPEMMQGHQRFMQEHRKVIEGLHKMDAELNKKVQAMNEAEGPAKVDAMAAAINELVRQREVIDQHMERLAQMGMAGMERRQAMGGPPMGAMSQGGMGQGGTEQENMHHQGTEGASDMEPEDTE